MHKMLKIFNIIFYLKEDNTLTINKGVVNMVSSIINLHLRIGHYGDDIGFISNKNHITE